jgi:hypothetical protein
MATIKARDLKVGAIVLDEDLEDNEVRIRIDSLTPGNGIVRFTGTFWGDGGAYGDADGYFGEDSNVDVES